MEKKTKKFLFCTCDKNCSCETLISQGLSHEIIEEVLALKELISLMMSTANELDLLKYHKGNCFRIFQACQHDKEVFYQMAKNYKYFNGPEMLDIALKNFEAYYTFNSNNISAKERENLEIYNKYFSR